MRKVYLAAGVATAALLLTGSYATSEWSPVALENTVSNHEGRITKLESLATTSPTPVPEAATAPGSSDAATTPVTVLTPSQISITPTPTPVSSPEPTAEPTPTPQTHHWYCWVDDYGHDVCAGS